ncbi:growth/differentiation factor 7 [Gopherus evgoodei]|uniref:Growth differentiation factor 7 n=1 Tax=Gopherus evgoodei TaxID=1825980 RepID=A0A8C4XZD4_9SAUR|nr:growth/differentiation factor 7 [Gopherus evgoodei]
MDLRAAAALCLWVLSACRPRDGLEAAAVRGSPGAGSPGPLAAASASASQGRLPRQREAGRRGGGALRNGTVVPHQYMVSLYRSLAAPEPPGAAASSGGSRADTVTGFADLAAGDDSPAEAGQMYLFDVSSLPETDEVVGAELRILRKPPANRSLALSREGALHHLLLSACPGADRPPRLWDSRAADILDSGSPRWEVFDVWEAMRDWREKLGSGQRLCFVLRIVSDQSGRPLPPGQLGFSKPQPQPHERALLVAFSHSKRKENLFKEIRDQVKALGSPLFLEPPDPGQETPSKLRRRRRTTVATRTGGRGQGKKAKTRCSRKTLHVNFKELGWDDWIIAPLDYEAYHCEGICDFPLRSHLEPTNHAIIQTLMNSMDPESTPPSCCVPSKLSPISILYIDSGNNVVYKQYEDMVVETCGCR